MHAWNFANLLIWWICPGLLCFSQDVLHVDWYRDCLIYVFIAWLLVAPVALRVPVWTGGTGGLACACVDRLVKDSPWHVCSQTTQGRRHLLEALRGAGAGPAAHCHFLYMHAHAIDNVQHVLSRNVLRIV